MLKNALAKIPGGMLAEDDDSLVVKLCGHTITGLAVLILIAVWPITLLGLACTTIYKRWAK